MKKKRIRKNNVIICNKIGMQKCPRCGEYKELIIYIYKNILWNKILLEIKSCKDCIIEYKQVLTNLDNTSDNKKNLIVILDYMLDVYDGKMNVDCLSQKLKDIEIKNDDNKK